MQAMSFGKCKGVTNCFAFTELWRTLNSDFHPCRAPGDAPAPLLADSLREAHAELLMSDAASATLLAAMDI